VYRSGIAHVAEFLYDGHTESRFAFLLRTTRSLALLFLPEVGLQGTAATALAVLVIAALFWLMARRTARGSPMVAPFAFLLTMAAANAISALRGGYPFGGYTRHEVFLFPFALLSLFAAIELARRAVPPIASNRLVWASAAGLLVAVSSRGAASKFPARSAELAQAQFDRFHGHFGTPPGLLADQYNFITVFGHYHDWRWRLRWQAPLAVGTWQVWEVARGNEEVFICREHAWQSDFGKLDLYEDVSDCLRRAGVDRVAVFRPQQGGNSPPWNVADTAVRARELAAVIGLSPIEVVVDGADIYASFQRSAEAAGSSKISIASASYGENCRAPAGNATAEVRESCEGLTFCAARPGAVGDPAYGCAKEFRVTFRCGDEPQARTAFLAAGAEVDSSVLLSCAAH
jgi:hypothetical protein